jgi:hypothetical protein
MRLNPQLPLLTDAAMQAGMDEVAVTYPRVHDVSLASTREMRFVRTLTAKGLLRRW